MGAFDGETLAERFRNHFGHTDHLYGALLDGMADDWEVGGVTREIFDGWEDAPARQFPQLRMLAGLFRIVLRGDAPQLEGFYPALGGDLDHRDAWAVVRPVLGAHAEELHASLREAPQTNEPARTAALLVGLAEAVRRTGLRRVRLLEPGASAGLGLLVDHYRFLGDGWAAGPQASPLVVTGCGAAGFVPEEVEVVDRRGCDVAPVDAATDSGATYLTSFVWPWQLDRHERLAAALRVAREHPVVVDRAPASTWVARATARTGRRRRAHRGVALGDPALLAGRRDRGDDGCRRARRAPASRSCTSRWSTTGRPRRSAPTRGCRCSPSTTTSSPPATTTGRRSGWRPDDSGLAGSLRTLSR